MALEKAVSVYEQPAPWRWLALLVLGLAILTTVAVRVRLLDFPLERDEGEYAYVGQLLLDGVPPYQLACNLKLPGVYLAYAAIMAVFGQTPAGIHLGLLFVHLATLGVLFLIARKFLDLYGAAIAMAAYALMILSPAYLGLAAHATHFVVLPALLGIWTLLRAGKNIGLTACLASGIFFGVAFLMKQPGIFLGGFGGLYLAWISIANHLKPRQTFARLGLFLLGGLLPFLAVCLWLKIAGVFPQFWFWTMTYPHKYVTNIALADGTQCAKVAFARIFAAAPALCFLSAAGLAGLFAPRLERTTRIFLAGFLGCSFLAICPGYYFREHYFILLAPAMALLAGFAVSWTSQRVADGKTSGWFHLPFLLAVLACAQSLVADRKIYFSLSPRAACHAVYGMNPFAESLDIARYLAEHTNPDERIAVIGDEPQIFFYAHRCSAATQIYPSQTMDPRPFAHEMQANMIHEIEQNTPAYLVYCSVPASLVVQPKSDHLLFNWMMDYISKHMELAGLIQFGNSQNPEATWGADVTNAVIHSQFIVAVYQRTGFAAAQPNTKN